MRTWQRVTLGSTGMEAGRLGMASSYGVSTAGIERAFDHGVNYLYYGSIRTSKFSQAIRNLAAQRERMVLVVQSYSRVAGLVGWSLKRALRALQSDYADVLLLGLWNQKPYEGILDASRRLRDRGLVRHIAVSSHNRPFIPTLASNPDIGILHVRYNAVHPGAEDEVFPHLPAGEGRPGVVSFTATSWGQLLKNSPPGEKRPSATDCYRFAMSNPSVDVTLSGPANDEQVTAALQALELGPLREDELEWMRRVGRAIHR